MKRNGVELMNGETGRLADASAGRNDRLDESDAMQKTRRSITYMVEHLDQPLQVATLAAAVNVSPSHYSALFKRCTGCPPIDFFIHLKMKQACRLFDSTSLNVKEVAAKLGYEDPFYFSRTFKAINRVAPSQYRIMPEEQRDDIKNAVSVFIMFTPDSPTDQRHNEQWPENDMLNGDRESRVNGCFHEKNGKVPA